jgi:hypothetical protein
MPTSITDVLQLGDLTSAGGLAVAPLFPRRTPVAPYATLDEALPLGLRIGELEGGASVTQLLLHNPTPLQVLLYDGEELLGAKQNRIVDQTLLVAASSTTTIPVACVEQGRWSWQTPGFAPAAQTASPEVRKRKAERRAGAPEAGLAQHEVWETLGRKAARLGVHSPTGAQAAMFDAHRAAADRLRDACPLQLGQSGALVGFGGAWRVLDYVSRPEAFARLYPKLLAGYALDAVEARAAPPAAGSAEAFVRALDTARPAKRPSAGVGEAVWLATPAVVGAGLQVDDELVQVSAFATDPAGAPASRIRRPSLRRG